VPRSSKSLAAGLLTGVGLIYVALIVSNPMPGTVHGDGYYTYLWARTLVFDGDMDFHEDYRVCPDPWGLARAPVADDVNYWNMGASFFWVPPLLWDRLTHPITRGSGFEARGCHGELAERAVRGSAVAALLAVLFGFLLSRRRFGEGPAVFGALAIGLLTGLAYYASTMLSYGHAASSFGAGFAIWIWDRQRRKRTYGSWAAMGAALGVAMLMRSQNAMVVVLPLGTWLLQAWRIGRPSAAPIPSGSNRTRALLRHVAMGFVFVAALLLVFSPQMAYWHSLTGSPLTVPQGEHYMRWGHPRPIKALFASGNGLFTWAPVMYLALVGWLLMLRRGTTRGLGVGLLILFALNAYVAGAVYDWWGSIGYPGRRFDTLAVPAMIGVAALGAECHRWVRRRRGAGLAMLAGLVLLLGLFWNTGVMRALAKAYRTDTAETSLTKWQGVFEESSETLWKAVGNPLTYPASIPWAIRHGVHPRQWDVVGSQELFYHDHQSLVRREYESTLRVTEEELDGYFAGSFGEVTSAGGNRVRVANQGSALVFLPLHWPDAGALVIRAKALRETAKIGLRVNGVSCGVRRVGPRLEDLRFEIPRGTTHHGINLAWLWIEEGRVGVETIEVMDPVPGPEVEQARKNEEMQRILEERRRQRGLE